MALKPATLILLPYIASSFSLAIPPATHCLGSDIEGEVPLKFPKVQDEQIDEVVGVALRGTLNVDESIS
uniref:Interferon-induced GTP-binding protein Mx n=1 Tax=Ganoderma boninense TaxID=34458 RepID=A0A5K1JX98_9APHY|nr:Interferon-induced GTP-binding protein Mx [Ganoderma boninense]